MYTISAILTVLGAGLAVLFLFVVFTNISFVRLLITMVPVLVFGFFLSYNIRRMVNYPLIPGQRQPSRSLQGRPSQWCCQNLDGGCFRHLQICRASCGHFLQGQPLINSALYRLALVQFVLTNSLSLNTIRLPLVNRKSELNVYSSAAQFRPFQ